MEKGGWAIAVTVGALAVAFLLLTSPLNFPKIDANYLDTYLRSQDIYAEVYERQHISDSHIYAASGFLYAVGINPTLYNFQHPPLIKYLFGESEILFGNPLVIQVMFSGLLIAITYFAAFKFTDNKYTAVAAAFLLALDPLWRDLSGQALLDMGQAVFALLYILSAMFSKKGYVAGIFLGLMAASKFGSTAFIYFALVELFLLWKSKSIDIKRILITLFFAFAVFNAVYLVSYIESGFRFNIFFLVAKTAKFMFDHNSATGPGQNLMLFLTGSYHTWWSGVGTRSEVWSILWPVMFGLNIYKLIKKPKSKAKIFLYAFPLIYILSLSTQVPFTRYFILVLPLFYVSLGKTLKNLIFRAFRLYYPR